jgi:peptide deformylase
LWFLRQLLSCHAGGLEQASERRLHLLNHCNRKGRGDLPWAGRAAARSGSDFSTGLKAIDRAKTSPYVSAMTVKPIITLPDPMLRKASARVERVDEDIRKLADDMLETMYAAPGVGLAAVQVGVPIRLIVLDTAKEEQPPQPLVLINPEILTLGSESRSHEEGCLSIPDVRIDIERPSSLTLRYIDREGKPQELAAEGLLATAVQHEIDHLNGKLIIDFLSRLKRDIIVRKFKKQAKADASA